MSNTLKYMALASILLISCQQDTGVLAYLVIDDSDSTYYHFNKNKNGQITNHKVLSKEFYVDLYQDSLLLCCIDAKKCLTQKQRNILNTYINGNHYSSLLLTHFITSEFKEYQRSGLDTFNVGTYEFEESAIIHNKGDYSELCKFRKVNEVLDTNCFIVKQFGHFTFDDTGYQKVSKDKFSNDCLAINQKRIDAAQYIKGLDMSTDKPYILVDFFTYYCAPCIKAIPYLNKINAHDSIRVIGIHPGLDNKARLVKFRNQFACSYELYGESEPFYYHETDITAYPHYILIDVYRSKVIRSWGGAQENFDSLVLEAISTN